MEFNKSPTTLVQATLRQFPSKGLKKITIHLLLNLLKFNLSVLYTKSMKFWFDHLKVYLFLLALNPLVIVSEQNYLFYYYFFFLKYFQIIPMGKQQYGRSRMPMLDSLKSRAELLKIRSDFWLSFTLIR